MTHTFSGFDMTKSMTTRLRHIMGAGTLGAALLISGCDAMLRANDPDIVTTATSAAAAISLRNGVVARLNGATAGIQGPDGIFLFGGLLADEWRSGDTFEQRNSTDARTVDPTNSFLAGPFRDLNRTRVEGRNAINALRTFAPTPLTNVALMFALTAYAENLIGETFCNGIPFSDVVNGDIVFGNPVSVDSAFKRAINDADSALANNGGVAAEVTRMANLASVVKGRALLNRAQFAAAATAVAAVPTSFTYTVTFSLGTRDNQIWALGQSVGRYVVPDREGVNGMPWISAADPRVPVVNQNRNAFDSTTPWFATTLWARSDSVIIASGIEARLIEAEAALQANDATTFLAKLNLIRATRTGLPPLTDPGTPATRQDLLFRERAFWMFGTGHRLGDLRRLVRQYGRGAETVFPTGVFPKGGNYGTDVNLPISFDELNNPNIPAGVRTTCTDRNA
jgi:starch-binding outer membrane protein, SusD/RagB family